MRYVLFSSFFDFYHKQHAGILYTLLSVLMVEVLSITKHSIAAMPLALFYVYLCKFITQIRIA
jgi:hypothetical protein